jgi:hypothetical protein
MRGEPMESTNGLCSGAAAAFLGNEVEELVRGVNETRQEIENDGEELPALEDSIKTLVKAQFTTGAYDVLEVGLILKGTKFQVDDIWGGGTPFNWASAWADEGFSFKNSNPWLYVRAMAHSCLCAEVYQVMTAEGH